MPRFFLTAQNIDIYDGDGLDAIARTGATSAEQIYRAGAEGVILGHSEVGDTPQVTRQKLFTIVTRGQGKSDFLNKLTLLVGESWDEFQGNSLKNIAEKIAEHLFFIMKDIPELYLKNLVVGYEPKWGSRGSGHDDAPPPSPELVSVVAKEVRGGLTSAFGNLGKDMPIIYGGRSTPERTQEILADENVEGLILGSACNTVQKTMDIARSMEKARPGKRKILHANFKAFNLSDSYQEYIAQLSSLDETFVAYLSPCHVDLRAVSTTLPHE